MPLWVGEWHKSSESLFLQYLSSHVRNILTATDVPLHYNLSFHSLPLAFMPFEIIKMLTCLQSLWYSRQKRTNCRQAKHSTNCKWKKNQTALSSFAMPGFLLLGITSLYFTLNTFKTCLHFRIQRHKFNYWQIHMLSVKSIDCLCRKRTKNTACIWISISLSSIDSCSCF